MDAVCISASNMRNSANKSISYQLCKRIENDLEKQGLTCDVIDLRDYKITPCAGCGGCFDSKRCINDTAFNKIYEKIIQAKYLFFVSPHYAPIPAKLCMLLEKMEEITFLHWWKDSTYQSEVFQKPTGIISHGGGADWALASYKAMVNDTIANALDTIQCKVIPFNTDWNTGIALSVSHVAEEESIFPIQEYDWNLIFQKADQYVSLVVSESDGRINP